MGTRLRWMRGGALAALLAALAALLAAWALTPQAPAAAQAQAAAPPPSATPRASATSIEHQLMCVTCKIPLPEAESPQAERERAYLKQLVGEGLNEAQIKRALVSEYGPAVLALPSAHGFDLAVYVVPPVAVLAAVLVVLLAVRRWRRDGGRQQDGWASRVPALSTGDAERLERDMAEHET
jgi:cytochrome c-type biogenesis protein CcmH/NrfF